jgi:PAS domain S-box-containing protein
MPRNRRKASNQEPPTIGHSASPEYHAAMAAARMGAWETNLVQRTRKWSQEAMTLFGLDLPNGIGRVGGPSDEYIAALHPDDRHLMQYFHETAQHQDFYEGEYRILRPDGSIRWVTGRALVVERGADGSACRTVTVVADITEQKETEKRATLLLHESSHRAKNLIAVIQGIARRTARTSASLTEFERRFDQRLAALAASHNVLLNYDWKSAPFDALVREQISSFDETNSHRITLEGPPIFLNPDSAQIVSLVLHELGTNAVKHGALSRPDGRVHIAWEIRGKASERRMRICWTESHGPRVDTPTRTGFGQTVIRDLVAQSLKAEVQLEFRPEGLCWTALIPFSTIEHTPGEFRSP